MQSPVDEYKADRARQSIIDECTAELKSTCLGLFISNFLRVTDTPQESLAIRNTMVFTLLHTNEAWFARSVSLCMIRQKRPHALRSLF